ncbi:MAG: hypothetical protein GX250_08405 [Clostridiales bacterium]|jgi:hypothetical protein|nr:hypothetical protein [Clostridiales bacterium]
MLNKRFFKKLGLHALLLIITYILQHYVFPHLPLWGVKPLILPVAAIGIGFFGGSIWGGVFGIFAGILCDIAFVTTPLFTLVMPLIGLASGLLSEYALLRSLLSYLITSLLGLLVISFLQLFPFLFFRDVGLLILLRVTALQCAYSLLFVFPLYLPVRRLSRRRR